MLSPAKLLLKIQILRFLLVGTLGFMIDGTLFYVAHGYVSLIPARAISISIALTFTWILNRKFTFQSQDPHYSSEWLRYISVYILGISLNFGAFTTLTKLSATFHQYPVAAIALATIFTAFFNYFCSRRFAFKRQIVA